MANFILVRIYVSKGDYTKTAVILKQLKDQLSRVPSGECATIYDIIEGWFYVKIGETGKIPSWILHEEETKKMLAPVVLGREFLVRTDYLLAEGREYELLAYMEHTDTLYESRGLLYALIQNKITRAITYHYMGNRKEALEVLYQAYLLSDPNGLVIQYIEYGNKMRTVIGAALNEKDCQIPREWLENIYTKSSTYAKRLTQVANEYHRANLMEKRDRVTLSKRESEVLTCLCHGLTREEIAINCDLSVNTVKSILQNIYNKLGAQNSIDAVRIAAMTGLI